ncbi:hypothetical protein GQ607_003681 [Colletotrichum asianum]|uniref:Uncharacterized protein n=1 Tax=Colletotrichum asianum TaxID=702518 RepID=A0A8H3WR30_9PEZI|nr:hypothetical protein GQ607_003681 [Colletotrichum asianum]
MGRSSLIPRKK